MKNKFIKGSNDNILYVTSRCSNRCIMCCQPPKADEDKEELYMHNITLIEDADKDTDYVCITGGEPTLIEERLYEYIHKTRAQMPCAYIHILTNGRRFSDSQFMKSFYSSIAITDKIILGIPLHADNPIDHDLIAGAKGSFYETLKGLHNLGTLGYEIELRIIIMKQNFRRLPDMAEFITRNLPFVAQVSWMGLEITGYAHTNYQQIWIDPMDYAPSLQKAVMTLKQSMIQAKIFNIPHCLLPKDLWPFACQSISNWKKTNLPQCAGCSQLLNCCGVFSTSAKQSKNIKSIL